MICRINSCKIIHECEVSLMNLHVTTPSVNAVGIDVQRDLVVLRNRNKDAYALDG